MKKKILASLLSLAMAVGMLVGLGASSVKADDLSDKVPERGIIYKGHYYYKYDYSKITWSSAKAYCEEVLN